MLTDSTKELLTIELSRVREFVEIRDQQYQALSDFFQILQKKAILSYDEVTTLQDLTQAFTKTYDTIEQQIAYIEGILKEQAIMRPTLTQVQAIRATLDKQEQQLKQLALEINDRLH